MELDKVLNILALFSVPLAIVFCRAWLKARELELRARGPSQMDARIADAQDLRQRIEALETIVTSDRWPPPASRPRVYVGESAVAATSNSPEVDVRVRRAEVVSVERVAG